MPVTPLPPIPPPPSVKGSGGTSASSAPPAPAPAPAPSPAPALDARVAGRVTPGAVPGTDPGPRLPRAEIPGPPGWPPLPARDAPNFTDAKPVHIPPGTKIYRIVGDGYPAGSYWAMSLPASEESWRSGFAVLDSWNTGTKYVEYTVPPGDGLHVWAGGTSGQGLADDGDPGHVLTGGEQQIWMPKNTVPNDQLTPRPTPWSGGGTGGRT